MDTGRQMQPFLTHQGSVTLFIGRGQTAKKPQTDRGKHMIVCDRTQDKT